MIHIDRGPTPAIPVFTDPAKAQTELALAQAHYQPDANGNVTKEPFDFELYKDPELSKALQNVFGSKCAYCESDFGPVSPKEVEHFRPKSEIGIGRTKQRPGYWWLACEWTNLLLACIDCNRRRGHEVPGQPKKVTLGKAAQFPVIDEVHRFRGPGPELGSEDQVRLLIDPCRDEPSDDLWFDEDGLVHARPVAPGAAALRPRGEQSIFVLALQRQELVKARKEAIKRMSLAVLDLDEMVADLSKNAGVPAEEARIEGRIARKREQIREMLAPGAVYIAALRDWLRQQQAAGPFKNLAGAGVNLEDLF